MAKLSDYSKDEIDFVMNKFMEDWPEAAKQRTTLTEKDKIEIMQTAFGSLAVIELRLKKLGRTIIDSFKIRRK